MLYVRFGSDRDSQLRELNVRLLTAKLCGQTAAGHGCRGPALPAVCRGLLPGIPHIPVRQWVLSAPIALRLMLASRPELVTPIQQVVQRVVTRHLLDRAVQWSRLAALRAKPAPLAAGSPRTCELTARHRACAVGLHNSLRALPCYPLDRALLAERAAPALTGFNSVCGGTSGSGSFGLFGCVTFWNLFAETPLRLATMR